MRGPQFDQIAEAYLLERLAPAGWEKVGKSMFVRRDAGGMDKLALDPGRGFDKFAVLMAYEPTDVSEFLGALQADDAYDPAASGFMCGPYLSLGKVGPRKHTWPSATPERLLASMERFMAAFTQMGRPWLDTLRDPLALAANVDENAAAAAGYVWERAGNEAKASSLYLNWLGRLRGGQELFGHKDPPARHMKEYLFLAARIGLEDELTSRYRAALG